MAQSIAPSAVSTLDAVSLSGDAPSVDLRAYLTALWRRRVVIVFCFIIVVATAMTLSYRKTALYRASAQVLLQSRLSEQVVGSGAVQYVDPIRVQKTESQIITSPAVQAQAEQKLGYAAGVSVRPLADTDIIFVDAVDRDPKRAAATANAYVDAYIAFRHKQAVDDLTAAGTEVQGRITDLQKQIDALRAANPAPAPATATAATASTAASPAQAQIDALVNQQSVLKQKVDQIQFDTALNSGGAQPVAQATAPAVPYTPNHRRDAILAAAVGIVFAIGTALLWEFLDDTIDGRATLERATSGLTTLALIPPIRGWRQSAKPYVVALADPDSAASEAYRSLRTSIQFARIERQVSVIQVTSASSGEGKSTTVANLGVVLARAGARVVIVCCDLRRPRLHDFFGVSNAVGFTSVMLSEASLSEACQEVRDQPRLLVLASGPLPPNPSELLSSRRLGEVIQALRDTGAIVLIDSPPILPVTDPALISRHVDATLVVASAGLTTRRRTQQALAQLRQVSAPVMGVVLNGAAGDDSYAYSYRPYKADRNKSAPQDDSLKNGKLNGHSNGFTPKKAGRRRRSRSS